MGIADINKFIREQKIDCFFNIPLTNFSNMRVAIDGLNWIFSYLGIVYKNIVDRRKDILEDITQDEIFEGMFLEWMRFNNKLLNHKVTPVWIWDGVSKDNKLVTKIERRKTRNEKISKKLKLKEQLLEMPLLARDNDLMNEYKKLVISTPYFSPEKIDKLKSISTDMGIPTIIAEDEAENLASSLAVERKVSAVWSSDTDTYPLGAPIVVRGFSKKEGEIYIAGVYTPNILIHLGLDHDEFRDFCILLGTDFNDRMDRIGPANAYKLIKLYRNIEAIEEKTKHNTYCLKKDDVRHQLTPYDTNIDQDDLNINVTEFTYDFSNDYMAKIFLQLKNNIRDIGPSKNLPKINKKN